MTNCTKSGIIIEGSRSRNLDFPNICDLFHRFSKFINDYLLANVTDSFLLVTLVNESDFSRLAPTRFSPLLFTFLRMLFLTKYMIK